MPSDKDNLEELLNKLKEYEELLESTDDDDDSLTEDFAKEIEATFDQVGSLILKKQQEDFSKLTLKFINKSNNVNPTFANIGDSGFDLRANLDESIKLKSLERALIPTGLFFEIDKGFEIQVRPRSGLAIKNGISVVNTPGTVDSHYRGEVKVILINLSNEPFTVNHGDRIAQAVVCPVYGEGKIFIEESDTLSETSRGSDGFGSSGVK